MGRKVCLGQDMQEQSLPLQEESLMEDGSDQGGGNP